MILGASSKELEHSAKQGRWNQEAFSTNPRSKATWGLQPGEWPREGWGPVLWYHVNSLVKRGSKVPSVRPQVLFYTASSAVFINTFVNALALFYLSILGLQC